MERGETKACNACRTAKRKCSRRLPVCERCDLRGLECVYQPQPSFILYGATGRDEERSSIPCTDELAALGSGTSGTLTVSGIQRGRFNVERLARCPSLGDLQTAWFLTTEAWTIAPGNHPQPTPVYSIVLKRYVAKVQGWLREWATMGSNPFIHSHLYKKRLPRCVQDAFKGVSSYISRTPATEDMVYRIIEDRVDELVTRSSQDTEPDAFEHLARVQMLTVYSIIRLFDGDIRQRSLAEGHLPTLHLWTGQMFGSTARAAQDGTLLLSDAVENPELRQDALAAAASSSQEGQETLLWHSWILSESVRRTWLTAHFILTIFEIMQGGVSRCPGGVMTTTRRGVWDAGSAFAWTRTCAERSVGFMHRNEAETVMAEGGLRDVDEFTLALLELEYGTEKMERWGFEVGIAK